MTVDWSSLRNPVLGYDDWSIKDACAIERSGTFHIFFSAFNTVDTDNAGAFCRWSDPAGWHYFLYAGKDENRREEFRGTAAKAKPWPRGWNRLALARSRDLRTWLPAGGHGGAT